MKTNQLNSLRYFIVLPILIILIGFSSFSSMIPVQKEDKRPIDLVCLMKVDTTEAYISKYKGKKYYFDRIECKKTFDMNPKKFIENKCVEVK